jgi:hypothetical protein
MAAAFGGGTAVGRWRVSRSDCSAVDADTYPNAYEQRGNKPLAHTVLLPVREAIPTFGKKMTQLTKTILYRLICALATVSCVAFLYGCGGGAQNTYTVSVKVSGISGSGLILQLGGGGDLAVMTDGTYTFATLLASGTNYLVNVKTQPTLPRKICSVTNDSGTIGTADVSGIAVTCITSASLTTLYSFTGGSDGAGPNGSLIQGQEPRRSP